MKKLVVLLLCCVLTALLFSGCGREASAGRIIRYDIPAAVTNLDPQFATDETARMIIANICEGLLTRDENGELIGGAAESYESLGGGTRFVFKLREDACWYDGTPVTADDFVFAFQRMFTPGLPSPFAEDYAAIENARSILNGTAGMVGLGVKAKGEKELEFRLAHPSPYFPELLAETPAMPCNSQFFEESRGRYGLDKPFVNANGPFYLDKWDNETTINLRPNPNYFSSLPSSVGGVNLRINSEDAAKRLQEGEADLAVVSYENGEKLRAEGFTVTHFDSEVWCVVFNQNSRLWGNPLLRQGLALTIDNEELSGRLPEKFSPTKLLIPPSSFIAGEAYRQKATAAPVEFDPEQGRRLFDLGLSSISENSPLSATIYVPDSADHLLVMGLLQQSWQKHLSAYVSVEAKTLEEIKNLFIAGDYEMLLLPLDAAGPQAKSMLSMFRTDSPMNHFAYYSSRYDSLLDSISEANGMTQAAEAFSRAESLLLHDAVIIPVYIETTAFAAAPEVRSIRATPYASELYFRYAANGRQN